MADLKPTKKIQQQEWMVSKQTRAVMSALGTGNALFVGGCVRNALAGFPVEDIDIATRIQPVDVMNILEKSGIKAIPTGIEHGTVTAVIDKKVFEITTLRKDIKTDGRRAVVTFTSDWQEDALRRDFTMNTLLADAGGNIYDPTGEGIRDLEAWKVRFVGDPAARIAEDHLRILRFFRFHAMYGRGTPDAKAMKACGEAAGKIAALSKERITQEFFKILSVDAPMDILELMFKNRVLKEFSFSECKPATFRHLCEFQNRYELAFIAARLFMLSGLKFENLAKMEKLLLIPKVFKKDIEAISQVLNLPDLDQDHAVRVAVYKYGRTPTAQALIIELVQDRVINGYAPKALRVIQKWDVPEFPLSGGDLKQAGISEGPAMGQKLQEIEEWWIAEDFKPGKKECLARI